MNNKGVWAAVGAYAMWGVFPIYWKALQTVPAMQILAHRVVWSFIFLVILLVVQRQWTGFRRVSSDRRTVLRYALAAVLLAINWLVYIWGVNPGHVVETSLGYFINPLVSVLLGVVFLGERLRTWQWVPVGLAGAGVLYLTIDYGALPWIALVLAASFGLYGLLKKTAPLGALYGLTIETGVLFVPFLVFLLVQEGLGSGSFGHATWQVNGLLALSGIVTSLPLLMFAAAARSIPLSLVGILQYIAPTGQLLLGVLLYGEAFTIDRLIGFAMIWAALLLFWAEGAVNATKSKLTTETPRTQDQ